MFLNSLNNVQKRLFLNLAIKASEANGVIELAEKNMLKSFAIEMKIEPIYKTDLETEDILREIVNISSETELKIVAFEILGIMISDSEFDNMEKIFVDNMFNKFAIPLDRKEEMLQVLGEYLAVFKKIESIIL